MNCFNSDPMGLRSPSLSMAQGTGGLASSPGHGRSLRDYEDKLSALRKDNFNLKLRIYFLEEKLTSVTNNHQSADGTENFFKQNIDLKVSKIARLLIFELLFRLYFGSHIPIFKLFHALLKTHLSLIQT